MKKIIAIMLTLIALAACAPAAGRPAIALFATTQQLVKVTVDVCPTIAPANHNYLSIESIGDNYVTCGAQATTGMAVFGMLLGALFGSSSSDQRLTASFTSVDANVVHVAISSFPRNADIEQQLESALSTEFAMVSLP
jgi:hypothetical protein